MLKETRREFGSAIKVRSRHRKCSDIVMNMSKDVGRDVMREKNIERWRKPIFESERRKRKVEESNLQAAIDVVKLMKWDHSCSLSPLP